MSDEEMSGKEIFKRSDESRKASGDYRRLNVGFVPWAGFPNTHLGVKLRRAKPLKHEVQH